MTELFNTILAYTSETITISSALITMLIALAFGAAIAFTYYKTRNEETYQRSMTLTLIMLPVILSVIIVFVGSNVARAFSLAGTLSIIRFRSAPGEPKDIGYIFFDIAAGLACGVGLYGYGAVFVLLLCVVMFILEKTHIFKEKSNRKILRITIPEDLNHEGAFEDIFSKYTTRHKLAKIKTTDLGSLFELSYNISVKDKINEQEFLNELRCRNGNLSIILSDAPTVSAK